MKGFVESSFHSGIIPMESLFHAMAAEKVSLIRPLKLPKLVSCNGDSSRSVYCYDKTVRNSENEIIEFSYGGDRLDPILMEGHIVPVEFY